jgi:hypothetical protein
MTIEIAELRKKITRRTALGGFGVVAAIPALAEECRIGPPAHAKGPLVWMDMDQVELDAAYDQSFYAPLLRQDVERRASHSDSVRTRLRMPQRNHMARARSKSSTSIAPSARTLRSSFSFTGVPG